MGTSRKYKIFSGQKSIFVALHSSWITLRALITKNYSDPRSGKAWHCAISSRSRKARRYAIAFFQLKSPKLVQYSKFNTVFLALKLIC